MAAVDAKRARIEGRAAVLRGDDIDTDRIIPARFLRCVTFDDLGAHAFEDDRKQLAQTGATHPFDNPAYANATILVGNRNFGCGSSREQPVVGLKAAGVRAVVAKSFARIFYRSAINQGLLLVECPDAVAAWRPGDPVELDAPRGEIRVAGKSFSFPKLPPEILAICEAGGLLPYTVAALRKR